MFNLKEVEIAKTTLSLAHEGVKEYEQHIGYYLIDAGRQALEQRVGYRPTIFTIYQSMDHQKSRKRVSGRNHFDDFTIRKRYIFLFV